MINFGEDLGEDQSSLRKIGRWSVMENSRTPELEIGYETKRDIMVCTI